MTRLLGVDLGERRIGIAVGDEATGISTALVTIRRATLDHDAGLLGRLAREQNATELVVGLPLRMDGSEGPQAAITRAWGEAMESALGLPVHWRDERLTSVAAEAAVGRMRRAASGAPPTAHTRQRHRAAVDRDAARRILQAELDARAGSPRGDASPVQPAGGARPEAAIPVTSGADR